MPAYRNPADFMGGSQPKALGEMTMFSPNSNPPGYLPCNGQTVSRTTYSSLFSNIGTTYGVGDGSTTFGIPSSPISGDAQFFIRYLQ